MTIRDATRRFVEKELVPSIKEIEHGGAPPYDALRKMVRAFGLKELAEGRFARHIAKEKQAARGTAARVEEGRPGAGGADQAAMRLIPIIELSRYSPGWCTALGAFMGLTANAILSRGTIAQKERWALPLLTLDKVGAWAITEPGSGSDAFGAMKASARRGRS